MTNYLHFIFYLFCFATNPNNNKKEIRVSDYKGNPIENVYAEINNKSFQYTNKEGLFYLENKDYKAQDSIKFSHLGYISTKYAILDLIQIEKPIIQLNEKTIELSEVEIRNLDINKLLTEAINNIPEYYTSEFNTNNLFNTEITLINSDNNEILINYIGSLIFRRNEKGELMVTKKPSDEYIIKNLSDYIFQIKPYNFTTIIPIDSHPIIRKMKDFDIIKYENINYEDEECIKIFYEVNKKHIKQHGSLIIKIKDKSILSLEYSINPIKNWIKAKTKRGIENIDLKEYIVKATYKKNDIGKYEFSSGIEEIKLENKIGKKQINTTSKVILTKSKANNPDVSKELKIQQLFN